MVQPRQQHDKPNERTTPIEELARRQGVEPLKSVDQLLPREPLFGNDEHAEFVEWLREVREADIA